VVLIRKVHQMRVERITCTLGEYGHFVHLIYGGLLCTLRLHVGVKIVHYVYCVQAICSKIAVSLKNFNLKERWLKNFYVF